MIDEITNINLSNYQIQEIRNYFSKVDRLKEIFCLKTVLNLSKKEFNETEKLLKQKSLMKKVVE